MALTSFGDRLGPREMMRMERRNNGREGPGPYWAPLGPYGPGPHGPPWALMGQALIGPLWALMGPALMGQALMGPLGQFF